MDERNEMTPDDPVRAIDDLRRDLMVWKMGNMPAEALLTEHVRTISALLATQQAVDVAQLKRNKFDTYPIEHRLCRRAYNSGWNDCIDHLHATGRLK